MPNLQIFWDGEVRVTVVVNTTSSMPYTHSISTMRRIWTGIFAINAFLLEKAISFHLIKYTRTRNNVGHSIGKRQLYLTTTQWLPSNIIDVSGTSKGSKIDAKTFCVSASSNSKADVKPHVENIDSVIRSLRKLCGSGSDIRGRFVDHDDSIHSLVEAIQESEAVSNQPSLTPFASYCIGYSYANAIAESISTSAHGTICIGIDPRTHGIRLAEAFACGVVSYSKAYSTNRCSLTLVFTGSATTPACASFVRSQQCDGAVVSKLFRIYLKKEEMKLTIHFKMITASHLPGDRNGFKLFAAFAPSGFTKSQVKHIGKLAESHALECLDMIKLQAFSSLKVTSALHVDWMPLYADTLKKAVMLKTQGVVPNATKPLAGLKLILNPGNGAGGFFQSVLEDLGADVSASINLEPDGSFPNGIPNPENAKMLEQTVSVCVKEQADLGIMLDTDADRCGFVAPRTINDVSKIRSDYEALNRNRLIALLGVVFAKEKPGCAVVTDSVTSEGLSFFLSDKLGLQHIRYVKGYANVIGKARQMTDSGEVNAELAIETSGHCAMRENGYLDDGTYTAVKIVSLLAQQRAADLSKCESSTLLALISDMAELDEVCELRLTTRDASLDTMQKIFDLCTSEIEHYCFVTKSWKVDRENLEGIRLRFGSEGQFFMLRKSLHDPIVSLQIEAQSKQQAREVIVRPLINLLEANESIYNTLNIDVLKDY